VASYGSLPAAFFRWYLPGGSALEVSCWPPGADVGLRACSTVHIRTTQLTMEPDNRPPNGVFAKVICRRTAPGAIDKHRARCSCSSQQPAFLVNATKEQCRFQGHWWPALPVEQLYDADGQELLLADFSRGKHILDHLAQVRDQGDIVIVDVGYSDMLVLDITAPRPPGFELFHVVRLITRQDAAGMLGMPSLCTLGHRQSTIPVVRTLYAMP
jgi:hypothetical protein